MHQFDIRKMKLARGFSAKLVSFDSTKRPLVRVDQTFLESITLGSITRKRQIGLGSNLLPNHGLTPKRDMLHHPIRKCTFR